MSTLNNRLEKQAFYLQNLENKRKKKDRERYKKIRKENRLFKKINRNNQNFIGYKNYESCS